MCLWLDDSLHTQHTAHSTQTLTHTDSHALGHHCVWTLSCAEDTQAALNEVTRGSPNGVVLNMNFTDILKEFIDGADRVDSNLDELYVATSC